jgi:hypothetical protein
VVLIRGSVSVSVVVTFLLAAVMLGAKFAGLFTFSLVREEYRKWGQLMQEEYGELILKTSVRELRCEEHEVAHTTHPLCRWLSSLHARYTGGWLSSLHARYTGVVQAASDRHDSCHMPQ